MPDHVRDDFTFSSLLPVWASGTMHATRDGMISSPAGGRVIAARLQARALTMQKESAWKSALRDRAGFFSGSNGEARPRRTLDEGVLVLGVVAVVALLVVAVIVMLLAWTTATLSYGVRVSCPATDDCAAPPAIEGGPGWNDDPRADAAWVTQ
jgi:hypothetical protein